MEFTYLGNDYTFTNCGECGQIGVPQTSLTNTGSQPLQDVEYARAVDPDQEQNITGWFDTRNFVSHQPNAGNGFLAEVQAFGLQYNLPMALQLWHPNAKAHVNQFSLDIGTPNTPLDFTNAPTQAAPLIGDVGVAVAVRFPALYPGQSQSFYVVYVLNTESSSFFLWAYLEYIC